MFICYHLHLTYFLWFLLHGFFYQTILLYFSWLEIHWFLYFYVLLYFLLWLAGFFVLYTFTLLKLLLVFGSCCMVSLFSVLSLSWIYQLEYLQDNYCTHWPYQVFIIHYLHILTRDSFTHPLVFPSLTRYWLTVFYFFL